LQEFVNRKIRDAGRSFEKKRNSVIFTIKQSINSAETGEAAKPRVDAQLQDAVQSFKDEYEHLYRAIKTELKTKKDETFSDLEEIITRFSDGDDEKSDDYIIACNRELEKFNELSMDDMFVDSKYLVNTKWMFNGVFSKIVGTALLGAGFWVLDATNIFKKLAWSTKTKEDAIVNVEKALPSIDALKSSLEPLNSRVEEFVNSFRKLFETDLVNIIQKQIEDAQADFANREKNKKDAEEKIGSDYSCEKAV
jgi:hypothetical protein